MNLDAVNQYIGRDWEYKVWDCWEQVREVSRVVFGVEIREVAIPAVSNPAYNRGLFEAGAHRKEWVRVDAPTEGCVVLFRDRKNRPVHIGLHITRGDVLHTPGSTRRPGRTVYESIKVLEKVYKKIEFYAYAPDNHN